MIFEAKMVAMEILNTNHTRFTLPIFGVRTEVATHFTSRRHLITGERDR